MITAPYIIQPVTKYHTDWNLFIYNLSTKAFTDKDGQENRERRRPQYVQQRQDTNMGDHLIAQGNTENLFVGNKLYHSFAT